VGELDHDRAAMLVTGVDNLFHPRHDFVFVGEDVIEYRRAVFRNRRRTGGHSHADAGARAFFMVGAIARFRHAVFRVGGFMAGGDDAIFQRQVFEQIRLQ